DEYYTCGNSIGRTQTGGVDLQPIETLRVVEEDFSAQFDRPVVAVGEGRHGVRELAVPVGIVGGEQDVVGGKELRHIAQGLLLRLTGHEYPAAAYFFRRLGLQHRWVEGAVFILLVHMLHPERDPADPRLEEGDAQILIL